MSTADTSQTPPSVSVLVVTYNSAADIDACLAAAAATIRRPAELLVLDNGSTDDTAAVVADRHPDVTLFVSEANLGFAAGVNALARQATGDYVLLLNPDAVLHEGSVDALIELAERRPQGGLYGGRCLTSDGELNPGSAWGKSGLWDDFCFASGLNVVFKNNKYLDPMSLGSWPRDTESEVGIVTGCLLLARRTVWDELAGFDEDYWLYGEDADLSARAWKLGYRPVISPAATITHDFGTSSPNESWRTIKIWTGKATMQYKHHSVARARLGVLLLQFGVWLRSRKLLDRLPGREHASDVWTDAWKQRRTWRAGFPAKQEPAAELSAPQSGQTDRTAS